MDDSTIALKPVKDLLGMNFFIPDYQRGYRWTAQQATDLLEDILTFAKDRKTQTEIYCVQPLVVQKKAVDNLAAELKKLADDSDNLQHDVEKLLKGTWNVVDGQQRLTTIYLILTALGLTELYGINYQTRENSATFLSNIGTNQQDKMANIDYYHLYRVYKTVEQWLKEHSAQDKKLFKEALLEKVNFIWYRLPDEEKDINRKEAIDAFKRLNIGKIPLTDAELVKALFLNRNNFDCGAVDLETAQRKIATEWDQIEYTLQDDAFWLFLHDRHYAKPTRIDFILDMICEEGLKNLSDKEQEKIKADEHQTFRYFYYLFNNVKEKKELAARWGEVLNYFCIFNEWFHDYKLYHYIGYLTTVCEDKQSGSAPLIKELVKMWHGKKSGLKGQGSANSKRRIQQKDILNQLDGTKEGFLKAIRLKICQKLEENDGFKNLDTFSYDENPDGSSAPAKTICVPILLLHNVETIIQQNQQLIDNDRYGMPNFTRFPFHLYKKEDWDVEHIRPNAGDNLKEPNQKRVFVELAKEYLPDEDDLYQRIADYLGGDETVFDRLKEQILEAGKSLGDNDKNKIWNYTLLDRTTNQQYGNAIFPVKRAFLMNKDRGIKLKINDGGVDKKEIAFVLPCTKNVFTKAYTNRPNGLLSWTILDAEAYLADMKEKLDFYINMLKPAEVIPNE